MEKKRGFTDVLRYVFSQRPEEYVATGTRENVCVSCKIFDWIWIGTVREWNNSCFSWVECLRKLNKFWRACGPRSYRKSRFVGGIFNLDLEGNWNKSFSGNNSVVSWSITKGLMDENRGKYNLIGHPTCWVVVPYLTWRGLNVPEEHKLKGYYSTLGGLLGANSMVWNWRQEPGESM